MLNGKGRHCQVIDHVVVDTGKIIVAGRGETDFRKYCETAGAIEPPSDLRTINSLRRHRARRPATTAL